MPWPANFHDRPAKITRVTHTDGSTVMLTTRDGKGTGRSPLQFFSPHEVPEFEGAVAWFEVERVKNGSRIKRVVKQVPAPE